MISRWGHDRVLLAALAFSFLLHLSMVTVFRIVVTFPRERVAYYDLSLVEAPSQEAFPGTVRVDALEAPSASDALQRLGQDGEAASKPKWPELPSVALPRLNFSELDMVRLSQTSLDTRKRYDELFEEERDDIWSQFGRRLSSVGELLTSGRRDELEGDDERKRVFAGHPAPGVDLYVEWMSPPYDRQLLVMQPIDAAWEAEGAKLGEPIVLVIRVNAQGRVSFVQMPLDDQDGLLNSAAEAMFRNLFEPLDNLDADEQHAAVIIQRGGRLR